jgi:hypothetical protein
MNGFELTTLVVISTDAQVVVNPTTIRSWPQRLRWFSPVSSINKADHHNITEILLKVVLSTINQTKPSKTRRQKSLEF